MKIETYLPLFPGFYGTIFEFYLDDWALYDNRNEIPEQIWSFIANNLWNNIDYETYCNDVAESACQYVEMWCKKHDILKDIVKSIKFQHVYSPKYYNFSNDAIYVEIDLDFDKLIGAFKNDPDAAEFVKERYTSYDGFISSYPNEINEFCTEDPVHITGSILDFFLWDRKDDLYVILEDIYYNEYVQYDKIIELFNDEYNVNISEWQDLLECDLHAEKRFLQQLTGIGLFEIDPEDMEVLDFQDEYGINKT